MRLVSHGMDTGLWNSGSTVFSEPAIDFNEVSNPTHPLEASTDLQTCRVIVIILFLNRVQASWVAGPIFAEFYIQK